MKKNFTKKFMAGCLCTAMAAASLTGCSSSSSSSQPAQTSAAAAETSAPAAAPVDGVYGEQVNTATAPTPDAPQPVTTTTVGPDSYNQDAIGEHTFTFGSTGADGCCCDVMGDVMNQILQTKTNGKMKIDVYFSGQLGTDASLVSDVQQGAVDFHSTNISNYQTTVPEAIPFDMPFLYNDFEEIKEKLAYNDELFDTMSGYFEARDYKLMPWQGTGWRQISTNKEITGIDSFKGMNMRIPTTETYIAVFNALGATTTQINSSELFLALQQGMCDGEENPFEQIYTYGFSEVQKYVTNSNHLVFLNQTVMSKQSWDALNEEEQKVLWDTACEAAKSCTEWSGEAQDYYLQILQDEGCTFIDFDSIDGMRDACREATFETCYHKYMELMEAAGADLSIMDTYLNLVGYEAP